MPIKSIREKKCVLIEATGSMSVEQAEDLFESLKKALSGSDKSIDLNLSGVTDSDISCLQLICSAHKSAIRKNKSIFISKISPELRQSAEDAGFTLKGDCTDDMIASCPWHISGGTK
jgi:anti-anti-sigma regulatory factor